MESAPVDNRRKEDRIVADNVYVVLHTQPEIMGQMVEISSTGMAFTFVDLGAVSQKLSGCDRLSLDLFATGTGLFLRKLPARIISNVTTCVPTGLGDLAIKRVGVEFVRPTITQQVQINALIRWRSVKPQPS